METSQEAPEEQIYKLTFRQVSILIRLPYGVVCVCSELLGIMAAHFPVSHSCPLQCLQHVAEHTANERCHNDARVAPNCSFALLNISANV